MEHLLRAEDFEMKLNLKVFRSDLTYPCNTSMKVSVQSGNFSGSASMDIDIREFAEFAADLCRLYEKLSGSARIEEPYGVHMYLSFQGDGKGHMDVRGELYQTDSAGMEQELRFANRFVQTYLKCFCYDLKRSYERYLE